MKKDKKHFKFYYNRYLNSYRVQSMTATQRGIYCHLFAMIARNKDGVKEDLDLYKVLKIENMEDWDIVKPCFYQNEGMLYHNTMDESMHKNKAQIHVEKSIKERTDLFIEEIKKYSHKYDRNMLNEFFWYWTELDKDGGKKMKFELQKTWETDKRLARWKRNNYKYGSITKNKQSKQQLTDLKQIAVNHLTGSGNNY